MAGRARLIVSIVATVTTVAIGVAVIVLLRPNEPVDATTASVRAAAEGALTALYFDDFPPADYLGGMLPSSAAAAIRARVVTDIERYFSPALQARYEPMILDYVGTIGSSDWDAAGGFSSLDWRDPYLAGDHATLELRATSWVLRRRGPSGSTPEATYRLEETMDWGFSLIQTDGQWRVDTLDGTCLQGCP